MIFRILNTCSILTPLQHDSEVLLRDFIEHLLLLSHTISFQITQIRTKYTAQSYTIVNEFRKVRRFSLSIICLFSKTQLHNWEQVHLTPSIFFDQTYYYLTTLKSNKKWL